MQDRPELAGANLQQEFAKALIGLLHAHVDMVEQLQNTAMAEPARLAAQEQIEAGSRRAIAAAVPQAAEAPAPKKSSSLTDDPEFEAALLELAEAAASSNCALRCRKLESVARGLSVRAT